MEKRIKLFLAGIGIIAATSACRQEELPVHEGPLIAHLKLDSTLLSLQVVADSLTVPREIIPGPGDYLWYAEQQGRIGRIRLTSGENQPIYTLPDIYHRKSTGVASMVMHPDFEAAPYLYVHYTYAEKDSNLLDHIFSRVVRLTWDGEMLGEPYTILDAIPGATYHNGSSMLIDHAQKLWLSLGDAGQTSLTQDPSTLFGKILRVNLDGSVPDDNPFPGSPVWSMGHRNVQGLTANGNLVYASEHGPINDDEINLIEKGRNYGWPGVHGFCDLENEKVYCRDSTIAEPMYAWTPTIAPAGMSYYNSDAIPEWKNSLLLANLKGRAMRVLPLSQDGGEILGEHIYLQKFLGRIRDVAVGPRGEIYLATTNLDWHPGHQPWMYDTLPKTHGDRIIKLQALSKDDVLRDEGLARLTEDLEPMPLMNEDFAFEASEEEYTEGQKLYMVHCAACHRPDGKGNIGEIPPLVDSEWVKGDKLRLIDITLTGLNLPIVVNGVRYEGEMPGYRHLKDEEISDILNFIRMDFGKVRGDIIAKDVFHQRKGLP